MYDSHSVSFCVLFPCFSVPRFDDHHSLGFRYTSIDTSCSYNPRLLVIFGRFMALAISTIIKNLSY